MVEMSVIIVDVFHIKNICCDLWVIVTIFVIFVIIISHF